MRPTSAHCAAAGAALCTLLWGPAALAQTLGQAPEAAFPWIRWLGALAFCLALGAAGAFALWARRGGGANLPLRLSDLAAPRPARRLKVLEAARVSPTLEVCLISLDGQEYALAATPHALLELTSRSAGLEPRP